MIKRGAVCSFISLMCSVVGNAGSLEWAMLTGAWSYTGAYTELASGEKVDQFGPDPVGLFIILPNGICQHIVLDHSMTPVVSGVLKKQTDAEAQALATGVLAWYGRCELDEATKTMTAHIDKSSFPNFDGVDQVREIEELTATTLRYVNRRSSAGPGASVHSVLKRVW